MEFPRRRKWLTPDFGKKLDRYLGRPWPWRQTAARFSAVGHAGGKGTSGSFREFFLVSVGKDAQKLTALQFEEYIKYKCLKNLKANTSHICTMEGQQCEYPKSWEAYNRNHSCMVAGALIFKFLSNKLFVVLWPERYQLIWARGLSLWAWNAWKWGYKGWWETQLHNVMSCQDKNVMSLNLSDICWYRQHNNLFSKVCIRKGNK